MDFVPELLERQVDTQDKVLPAIIIFELDALKQHYDENYELIEKQFSIADSLYEQGKTDAAETVWRTQIVLLASAFDFFMHEIIWYGLNQIFNGDWDQTPKYKKMTITFEQMQKIKEDPDGKEWFERYITELYKKQTLMFYDDVKDHLALIGINVKDVARTAFYQQGCTIPTDKQMKENLNKVYWRRNHIAHQSDRSERDAERLGITKDIVLQFIEIINKIVVAIIEAAKIKNM